MTYKYDLLINGLTLFLVFPEDMVSGLQQVPWTIYDVSFMNAAKKYEAHNLIQVRESNWCTNLTWSGPE